ncbi:hypothetical protein BGX28_007782 [Mortierella sp. GBA30]|nr:hypothetical protein BGX28_007782 [Mortierella sp. GBA30]
MDAWTRHQHLIGSYVKYYQQPGAQSRQETTVKTELDILHENHRFLRCEKDDQDMTWEQRVAKKYYDKLFKEYALVELKYYKEGRVAMRWRTEKEVFRGKGQFTCGSLRCDEPKGLKSWEVNFGYVEQGEKKNALVKIRLCEKCSYMLNYKKKHRVSHNEEGASPSKKQRRKKRQEDSQHDPRSGSDSEAEKVDREESLEKLVQKKGQDHRAVEDAGSYRDQKESAEMKRNGSSRHHKDRDRSSRKRSRDEENSEEEDSERSGNSSKKTKQRRESDDAFFEGLFD